MARPLSIDDESEELDTTRELAWIWWLMSQDRARARAEYAALCGRSPEDRRIDDELEEAVRQHDRGGDHVTVPFDLVLGVLLRPRGKGRGRARPEDEPWKRRQNGEVLRYANVLWAKLDEDYLKRTGKKARQTDATLKDEAAKRARRMIRGNTLSVDTIKKRMSLTKGRSDLRRKRRS